MTRRHRREALQAAPARPPWVMPSRRPLRMIGADLPARRRRTPHAPLRRMRGGAGDARTARVLQTHVYRGGFTMTTGDAHGVIFNVDSVLRLASPRRQLARLRALRTTSLRDRRSALAMPRLVRALSADLNSAPVFYLTAFSIVLAKPITALLERDGYPSGTLLTTGRSFTARWVFGGSRTRKLAGLERLADRMPDLRWVLLGDDGGHDPHVFVDCAHRYRDRVAVIALRQVLDVDSPRTTLPAPPG